MTIGQIPRKPGRLVLAVSLAMASAGTQAQLQRLDDADLSHISGQSGISIESQFQLGADSLNYFDDGNGISLDGFKVGSSSGGPLQQRTDIDIGSDGSLNLSYMAKNQRIEFSDLRLSDNATASGGGMYLDQDIVGTLAIKHGGALSGDGYTYDAAFDITNGRLGYRTNGNEIFLDDMSLSVSSPGMTLDLVGNVVDFRIPALTGSFNVGAIRYSNNPLNHGNSVDLTSGAALPSYGGISGDFDLSAQLKIQGGGRFGTEGLRLDGSATINSANFIYSDDTHPVGLKGITGNLAFNDLRVDVAPDWNNRLGLALTLGDMSGNIGIDRVELGDSAKTIGSVNVDFVLSDQTVASTQYTNALYIEAGGNADAGNQGLRLATEWSLSNGNLAYTDDGNTVVLSGLKSWGRGDITVNVTKAGNQNGTEFYDGLRIGFEDVKAGYSFAGLRVGHGVSDAKNNGKLQGGTELLLALGFYPSYDFTLNGQVTIGPGGSEGANREGLTINSDMYITNGHAALIADETGAGLWASDLSYDQHVRNMTVDATSEGLSIIKGEAWGTMDIGNLRIGDKDGGKSFGRVVLQTYETGSSMVIKPGGAGNVCVGGSGATADTCTGDWETRGEQGVTIALKQVFAKAISDAKRNRLTWETNRQTDADGNPINGTGMQLVINDFHTSDGGDFNGDGIEDNTFGIQTDLNVDVYQTKVVKKGDGADMNGVIGNKGAEKIMDGTGGYTYVDNPTDAQKANRPLGFAVRAHTQFKELSVSNVDLVHPQGGAQTIIYGLKMQNMDLTTNLTATPLQ